jgi:hypothetical protein
MSTSLAADDSGLMLTEESRMESGILTNNAKADGEPKSNRPSIHAENEHALKKTSSKSSKVDTPAKEETDSNIVDWAGPDDAENPQNW